MDKSYIYSYRLTYFGGTAPCYDGNYLSLAICKRDMRRVIGYRFMEIKNKGQNNSIWIIGIAGKALQKSNNDFESEEIIYIAKISDVKTFCEYFSNVNEKRLDKIYKPNEKGDYINNSIRFCPTNEVHTDKSLWDIDWDLQHINKENYVLISYDYSFLNKEQSDVLKKALTNDENGKIAKGVGHTWFECEDNCDVVKLLDELVKSSDKNHNTKNLPASIRKNACSKCGKERAI